jgi:Domain of unknown function (DUF5615)
MKPRFLLDENLSEVIKKQLLFKEPAIEVVCIGEQGVPPKGTLDPDILLWIEQSGYILVTNNRTSMPNHVADHFNAGRSFPGILQLKPDTTISELIDTLQMIWQASEDWEYYNTVQYVPL